MKNILAIFGAVVVFFALQMAAYADIAVSNATGTIEIIAADGSKTQITPPQPIPPVADGAQIVILSGSANIVTTGSSTVTVKDGDNSTDVTAGSSVTISLNTDGTTSLAVTDGQATITDKAGDKALVGKDDAVDVVNGAYTATSGTVTETDTDGKVTILRAKKKNPKVEPYTPPPTNNGPQVTTQVQTEEGSRDLSTP